MTVNTVVFIYDILETMKEMHGRLSVNRAILDVCRIFIRDANGEMFPSGLLTERL